MLSHGTGPLIEARYRAHAELAESPSAKHADPPFASKRAEPTKCSPFGSPAWGAREGVPYGLAAGAVALPPNPVRFRLNESRPDNNAHSTARRSGSVWIRD